MSHGGRLRGREKIVRFLVKLAGKGKLPRPSLVRAVEINGLLGFLIVEPDGKAETLAFESDGERIRAIYAIRNPEKLAQFGRMTSRSVSA
jgi:RNA polymerase sigma-70 factor (ECF subfamily)